MTKEKEKNNLVGLSCIENPTKSIHLVLMSNKPFPETGTIFWSNIRERMTGGTGIVSLGPKREFLANIGSNDMVTAAHFRGRGPKYANEFNLPPSVWIPGGTGKASRNPFRNGITPYSNPNSNDNRVLFPTSLAARGGSHMGVVHSDGHVYMWGSGGNRLGLGNNVTTQSIPQKVPNLENIVAIALGDDNTLALNKDGKIFAWGVGEKGQLGNGNQSDSSTPVEVSVGEMTSTEKVVAIAAGNECSFALTDHGRVYGWGLATNGRLGIGTNPPQNVLTPRRVDNLNNVHIVAIATGRNFSLAIDANGKVYSWGSGSNGKLGSGNTTSKPSPSLISRGAMPSNYVVKAIACGAEHSLALLDDGRVYAWGSGENGRLGTGSIFDQNTPVLSLNNIVNVAVAIACGLEHSIVLSGNNRRVYGVGSGANGRLGLGNTNDSLIWGFVDLGDNAGRMAAVECGRDSTYALRDDGTLFSWGAGSGLVLGSGNESDRLVPDEVDQSNMPNNTLF